MTMTPVLVSMGDAPSITVDQTILLLGRSSECDVVVDSRKVSRQHCCIARLEDHLVIRDLGSTNGIRMNGQRQDECQLRDGDEFTIGNVNYRLEWKLPSSKKRKAASAPPPSPPPAELTDSEIEDSDEPMILPEDSSPRFIDDSGSDPVDEAHLRKK